MRRSGPPSVQAIAVRSPMSIRSVTVPPSTIRSNCVGQRHRRPNAALGVEADAVGRPVEPFGEESPIGQRPVGSRW